MQEVLPTMIRYLKRGKDAQGRADDDVRVRRYGGRAEVPWYQPLPAVVANTPEELLS